jgi:hypothetical protein
MKQTTVLLADDDKGVGMDFRTASEWFGHLIKFRVPVGYEDETGFHFRVKPTTNEFNDDPQQHP